MYVMDAPFIHSHPMVRLVEASTLRSVSCSIRDCPESSVSPHACPNTYPACTSDVTEADMPP
jgi:hypothetical protein